MFVIADQPEGPMVNVDLSVGRVWILALGLLSITACSSTSRAVSPTPATAPVCSAGRAVLVTNPTVRAVDVYSASAVGTTELLGMVEAASTVTYPLSPTSTGRVYAQWSGVVGGQPVRSYGIQDVRFRIVCS